MPVKLMVMVKRKAGLSLEAFRTGYENGHSRLAVRLFGHLWTEYRRNYLGAGNSFAGYLSAGGEIEIGYDAVSEIVFEDEAAIEEMLRIATLHYDEIQEDELRWFDRSHCWMVNCETIEEDLSTVHARHREEIQA